MNDLNNVSAYVPVIKIRQPDGSLMVKAGKPEIIDPEVSVAVFHKATGISKRHIATLCEQGLIQHRRMTPKKDSKILIPRSEIDRFRRLDDESADAPKTPAGKPAGNFGHVQTPAHGFTPSRGPARGQRIDSGKVVKPQKSTRK